MCRWWRSTSRWSAESADPKRRTAIPPGATRLAACPTGPAPAPADSQHPTCSNLPCYRQNRRRTVRVSGVQTHSPSQASPPVAVTFIVGIMLLFHCPPLPSDYTRCYGTLHYRLCACRLSSSNFWLLGKECHLNHYRYPSVFRPLVSYT